MRRLCRQGPQASFILSVVLTLSANGSAIAQQVEFRRGSAGSARAEEVLEEVLSRGRFLLITADTVLGAHETLSSDVLLLGATLRVEGRIRGDLIAVQSDVFVRPGARFDGAVAVLAGGFYGSSLARLRGPLVDASTYEYSLEEGGDEGETVYLIIGPGGETGFHLPGLYGFLTPQYERVSALVVSWGVGFRSAASDLLPEARARLRFRTAPENADGDLELRWPLGRHDLRLQVGRTVRSNDRWSLSDLENSLYSLVAAQDGRNYYRADFVEGGLHLAYGSRITSLHDVVLGWERPRSLVNRRPFSVFSTRGGFQPNLPVLESDIVSLRLRNVVQWWSQRGSLLDVELDFEYADRDLAGDVSFTLLAAALRAQLLTFADGRLILEGRGQFPASREAPPQRWRALGGWGSLPTLVATEREGDRFWWAAADYRVPLLRDAVLAQPLTPWVRYAVGNAWSRLGERPAEVHNIALGIAIGPLSVGAFSDPDDDFRTVMVLTIGGAR